MQTDVQTSDCTHCGMDDDALTPERVAEIVAEIPIADSLKADEAVYKERLAVCSSCERLRGKVMCADCGCFVLFRARPAKSYCPHPLGDKWIDIK